MDSRVGKHGAGWMGCEKSEECEESVDDSGELLLIRDSKIILHG